MLPITILAVQKFAEMLVGENALQQSIVALGAACQVQVPPIAASQILLSSAGGDLADRNAQFSYPRVLLYSEGMRNVHREKFRSLSGTVFVVAEVVASANLLDDVDRWIHFYVEALSGILRIRAGDWGDGIFYTGVYDVQFSTPKVGGIGFVKSSKMIFTLNVSRS